LWFGVGGDLHVVPLSFSVRGSSVFVCVVCLCVCVCGVCVGVCVCVCVCVTRNVL
jgi:hypothetical protein